MCTEIRAFSLISRKINLKTTTATQTQNSIQTHNVVMIRYGSSSLSADL